MIHIIAFEFEDGMYSSKHNSRVVLYTQYIVDVTQDVLVLLKAIVFNCGTVPYVRVFLSVQEPNVF